MEVATLKGSQAVQLLTDKLGTQCKGSHPAWVPLLDPGYWVLGRVELDLLS